jgi:pyruvate formate lyase activating enzyme
MLIGGLEKLTLIDYPGEVAAIIFTPGCNFRCRFCYNPMLVEPKALGSLDKINHPDSLVSEGDLFSFLENRRGKLDAVVITGGEPTLHHDLPEFIQKIKKLGYKVKLDTNGTNPEMLKTIINRKELINYIAMDIKAPLEKYQKVVGTKWSAKEKEEILKNIKESINIVMTCGLPYEFRTTVVPDFLDQDDIEEMGKLIQGACVWYLQKFKSNVEMLDNSLRNHHSYSDQEMKEMKKIGERFVVKCEVRG